MAPFASASPNTASMLPDHLRSALDGAQTQVNSLVLGKPHEVRLAFVALLSDGHLLIEDLPGLGKTTLAHALAATLGLRFQRVQFTSDLLPADIVGVSVFDPQARRFEFHPGPVFTQVLLADEINRAPPRTQSALLEAMAEHQVTVDGASHALPSPFFVIATQNPVDLSGTYPLPDSQLDRFLLRLALGYPGPDAERDLLAGTDRRDLIARAEPRLTADDVIAAREAVTAVHASDALIAYVQALLLRSRKHPGVRVGLSPRAGLALLRAARAYALLLGLLLGGAGLASLVAAQLQLTGLSVIAVEAEPVPAGAEMLLRVHARADEGRRRRGLRVALEPPAGSGSVLNIEQGHGEAGILLATERRGWLDLPRIRVSTTRPLGLARAWSYVWSQAPLLVYPRPEVDGPPLPSGSGDRVQSRVQPTGDDVHHLRGYRSGDSRRAIAWKPSARRDTLLVREYEQPLGADIVLDWRGAGQLPHEARISRLARWVDEAEREGRRYRLALPGVPALGPGHGAVHRHACLRALALMPHG